jgi:hypothetical protein
MATEVWRNAQRVIHLSQKSLNVSDRYASVLWEGLHQKLSKKRLKFLLRPPIGILSTLEVLWWVLKA